ncbi:hypothetical protein CNMCM8980_000201 [Aspergillus fumigatiaffinis]|nr:hypothetical protein CNMCM6457_007120 [Aspergillus fumigatiaffinis]KAF4243061.1 hypothetical protein CNMCM8980_000201 [Aspergillus fumigatiaffinis]
MLSEKQAAAHEAYDSEQASPRGEALDEEGEIFEKTASGVCSRCRRRYMRWEPVHRLVVIPGRSGDHRNGIHLQIGARRLADLRGIPVIYVAVLIVVVGVTTRDRPAAAPQEGRTTLGSSPSITRVLPPAWSPPVASLSPRPKKPLYMCMALVTASYLVFSVIVYRWCGKCVASPSLGSAGQTTKMVSYAVAFIRLIVSGTLYLHVAAKYVVVRILGNSRHLQANTVVRWVTWFASTDHPRCAGVHSGGGDPDLQLSDCARGVGVFCPSSQEHSWLVMVVRSRPLHEGHGDPEGRIPVALRAW